MVAKLAAEASANNLLDNAGRVCTVVADESYEFYHKQKEDGKLSSSVPDACV
jgi:hypothetical protein